jgi:hypothetical protein
MMELIDTTASLLVYAVIAAVLVGYARARVLPKLAMSVAAAAWAGLVVTIAVLGGFASGITDPLPAPVLAAALMFALLFGAWWLAPALRAALDAVPLPALVALNAARMVGVMFLLLAADGRLSWIFAFFAGWGDILTGLLAIPVALLARRGIARQARIIRWWNRFGSADLLLALTLGALSARGAPFQLFTGGPGTLTLTQFPWVMIPAMLVPTYLLIHLMIAARLRSAARRGGAGRAADGLPAGGGRHGDGKPVTAG